MAVPLQAGEVGDPRQRKQLAGHRVLSRLRARQVRYGEPGVSAIPPDLPGYGEGVVCVRGAQYFIPPPPSLTLILFLLPAFTAIPPRNRVTTSPP